MPDYMYLLESRLSPEQRAALERVQELARMQDMNVYLTGGAIRDLISGQPIRELDFTVEGNPVRMVRELEKGGARVLREDERLRSYEIVFAGDADGSISAARDEVYERPGAKPDLRFATIIEDLRRRDVSMNAIAISLNPNSRGLLLDPTNGLADLERQEVRALSIHAFTNQPARLMLVLRYCARMGLKMESRTQEWFELAMERGLHEKIEGADAGDEVRALAREEQPTAILKQWESRGLLAAIHPQLPRRKPDYESLNKLARIRQNYLAAAIRPRLPAATTYYILARLKSREASAALRHMEFRAAEIEAISKLDSEAQNVIKMLKGRKTNSPREAYFYLASVSPEILVFLEVETPNPRALSKIRSYIQKWRPLRLALPVAELDALGVPRGPKFDNILEQLFEMQLRGKARTPEDRTKALRSLAGIKEEPKRKEEKKKEKRKGRGTAGSKTAEARPIAGATPTSAPPAAELAGAKQGEKNSKAAASHAGPRKHTAPSRPKGRPAKKARGR